MSIEENDKRLFVPKTNGLGWTLNFNNKWSYVVLAAILGSIIFSMVYGMYFQK